MIATGAPKLTCCQPEAVSPLKLAVAPLNAPAVAGVYKWNNVTPRLGLTYALGADKKTLLRAGYIVLADRYIYTAFARRVGAVKGAEIERPGSELPGVVLYRGNGRYDLVEGGFPPGARTPLHRHRGYAHNLTISG